MLLTCLLGTAILFGLAAGDAAAEKGVHFDPESPAGKEYALPLAQARNEGAGKTGVGKDGSIEPAPLFGEGVGGSGGRGGEGVSHGGEGASHGGHGPEGRLEGEAPFDKQGAPGSGGAESHGAVGARLSTNAAYSTGTGLLLVAAILIAGLAFGLGLRRLSRPHSA
jgi:hypothetical protein